MKQWKPSYETLPQHYKYIAQGALTNSKRLECLVKGVYPGFAKQGKGALLYADKGVFIDFVCGLGVNLLGYAEENIFRALMNAASQGCLFSLSSELEWKLAERINQWVPFVEQIKILKSGSDGCASAVKIARAFTGRSLVLTEGYHGHNDEFVSLTPPALGCVQKEHIKFLKDKPIDETVAAVIIEPIITDFSPERLDWLRELRKECTKNGALLIFDETITAFRFKRGLFSVTADIIPDLVVFGKALANGMPISIVGGKTHIMSCNQYFVSTTYAGETLTLSAAIEVLKQLELKYDLTFLWNTGEKFKQMFNEIDPLTVTMEGYPTRGVFKFKDDMTKALFFQECCKAGILVGPSWFWSFPLQEYAEQALIIFRDVIYKITKGGAVLEGEAPQSPFAAKLR